MKKKKKKKKVAEIPGLHINLFNCSNFRNPQKATLSETWVDKITCLNYNLFTLNINQQQMAASV